MHNDVERHKSGEDVDAPWRQLSLLQVHRQEYRRNCENNNNKNFLFIVLHN